MLRRLTSEVLQELLAVHAGTCVSMFLPTPRFAPEAAADAAQGRRLLADAEAALAAAGRPAEEVAGLLAPVRALFDDPSFWRSQGESLALFAAPGTCTAVRLDAPAAPAVEVGTRFHLSSLVAALPAVEGGAALRRYSEMGERAASDPDLVLTAASEGRVDTLFLVPGTRRWGTFDRATREVRLHAVREPGDDDLADLAVALTLEHGGAVVPTTLASAPDGAPLAALLRD